MFSHQQEGPTDSVGTAASIKEPADVATFLETRGCSDITSTLNKDACSKTPWSGSGYGDIYRGALNDGTKIAIKTVRQYEHELEELGASGYYKRLAKELHKWSKCKHLNVAELLGWVVFNESLAMVSKWMDQGNVTSYLQSHPTASRYSLSFSICKGLAYLHEENIVHGNLKAAPELLRGTSSFTVAGDIHALGMTILEIFTGKIPYAEMSDAALYMHIVYDKILPLRPGEQIPTGDVCGDRLWSLLTSCWSYDPEPRPNVHVVCAIAVVIAQIQGLTTEERLKRAVNLNNRGNLARKDPELAVDFYTQAIVMSPWPHETYYYNQASNYMRFKPPQLWKAVEDCTQAILFNPKHAKAVNQRAIALEKMDDLIGALRDFTTLDIIEDFKNDATSTTIERVLYKLSTQHAKEIISSKEPRFPSTTYLSTNFAAFLRRPNVVLPDGANAGDLKFLEAQKALSEFQYAKAYELVNAALDCGLSENWKEGLAEALNLHGTFKFLMDDAAGANTDFETSTRVWPDLAQSWVLLARASKRLGKTETAFVAFEIAVERIQTVRISIFIARRCSLHSPSLEEQPTTTGTRMN
ncbi:unnamed protein product [Rhizoctonia solani]|uniref:Protein kinase domain-containing protein n=1 Tax=Rhizoctonia solani TaxID=456999 RepID=A0A8H3H518_9AGAM|nr:unnamed protein product [Rhizoctonia solani]